ncbi:MULTISPECIES: hypothetical protein [Halocynthiibacter]|uniref:Morphogenetic protein n=1 Tax=Halocynthiibacter halioticoli TaxID=2986804 RepID=A0AAE3J3L8_9RHOB|nr:MULTISPECIES: hypothetical protein [Halocynthiibacter]MCV6826036.1 hypothetical protein [Halocynthiibacter halioticoli]MCW4059037.1 hypothetical protein [Halocynthiibacter sp. SDUM655004]
MTDKPILFSGEMVRALLDGRKTQTRRVLKPQIGDLDQVGYFPDGEPIVMDSEGGHQSPISGVKYAVGDRLWVREAWKVGPAYDDLPPRDLSGEECLKYMADGAEQKWGWEHSQVYGRNRPSMFMPRWASRLTLTVTDVRVQRLQDISESDAEAEGIEPYSGIDPCCTGYLNYQTQSEDGWWLPPVKSFRTLWDSLNAKRGYGWAENPWVVAYTFTVERINIDAHSPRPTD